MRERIITEAECEESLKRMKATKRMQGTVLIEMGCISPHNLSYALTQQMQEKLYDAFRWDDGLYRRARRRAATRARGPGHDNSAGSIVEGVRRTYDEKRLSRVFTDVSQLYVHPSDEPLYALQDAGLSDEEKEIALVADGHKTVATLRALNVMSPGRDRQADLRAHLRADVVAEADAGRGEAGGSRSRRECAAGSAARATADAEVEPGPAASASTAAAAAPASARAAAGAEGRPARSAVGSRRARARPSRSGARSATTSARHHAAGQTPQGKEGRSAATTAEVGLAAAPSCRRS